MSFIELIVLIVGITTIIVVITLILNRKAIPNIKSNSDVINILHNGDRLKAIKAYRQLHGVGLKEAKDFIDEYDRK
jgi:ribosomal protein L7/L12